MEAAPCGTEDAPSAEGAPGGETVTAASPSADDESIGK
jgi:hypothetical protein